MKCPTAEIGQRIKCIEYIDSMTAVPRGALGTVRLVDAALGTLFVRWDNGKVHRLIEGVDQWEIVE